MSTIKSNVWDRGGSDVMSRSAFYFVIGIILAWGFVLTSIIAKLTGTWEPRLFGFLLIGLALPLCGILLSHCSGNAFVSFIGFNMVVGGIAAIIGPLLLKYHVDQPGLVERAATMTALVAATMSVTGLLFPKFYASIGGALFGALTALVVVSFVRIFIPALQGVGIIDYISAGIFSLYIGYDMWRASEIGATLDNAVDVAVALYLDIINLFLDLLRIMSKAKD